MVTMKPNMCIELSLAFLDLGKERRLESMQVNFALLSFFRTVTRDRQALEDLKLSRIRSKLIEKPRLSLSHLSQTT